CSGDQARRPVMQQRDFINSSSPPCTCNSAFAGAEAVICYREATYVLRHNGTRSGTQRNPTHELGLRVRPCLAKHGLDLSSYRMFTDAQFDRRILESVPGNE